MAVMDFESLGIAGKLDRLSSDICELCEDIQDIKKNIIYLECEIKKLKEDLYE